MLAQPPLATLPRRMLLGNVTTGLMGIGLSHLLGGEARAASGQPVTGWQPGKGQTHFPARAQRVLQSAPERPRTWISGSTSQCSKRCMASRCRVKKT